MNISSKVTKQKFLFTKLFEREKNQQGHGNLLVSVQSHNEITVYVILTLHWHASQ